MKKKDLFIAFDTGFDFAKIIVNGTIWYIPFNVQEITPDWNILTVGDQSNFILCTYEGKQYVVGETARKYSSVSKFDSAKFEKVKETMEDWYSIKRFKSKEFEAGFFALIGYVLYKFEEQQADIEDGFKINELAKWNLILGVALPHQYNEQIKTVIEDYIKNGSTITLKVASNDPIEIKLNFSKYIFNSQTICVLLNEVLDDNGDEVDNKEMFDVNSLPALILDGGYKTLGMFVFEPDYSIASAESNIDFAMNNINEAVANRIKPFKSSFYSFMVEEYEKSKRTVNYIDENRKSKTIDLIQFKEEETKKVIANLMQYILKKYDDLVDIRTVLMAGGTGQVYFDEIKNYLEEERPHLLDRISLPKGTLNSEVVEPVYAVVAGLYKGMLGLAQDA